MVVSVDPFAIDFDSRFKTFHELMSWKVRDILLVSTPYEAWVLEEDCRLSERIITEYRGLNLSKPPRFTWVRSAEQALAALDRKKFDLVLTMARLADMNPAELGCKIKAKVPDLPVILLSHVTLMPQTAPLVAERPEGIDRSFVWAGDTDILVALVKSAEDAKNARPDTQAAGIRIILFVQKSPYYLSSLLPILYREVVSQTQSVLESGLNEEHRMLTMRGRPKILIADTYEEALDLFQQFEPYILGVISDNCIHRNQNRDIHAGLALLTHIKQERFDIPLLLVGSNVTHARQAADLNAKFVDKNSASLRADVRAFFKDQLGFGDFIFKMPNGKEIARASNLRTLAENMLKIPEASFISHSQRNDFSRWLFARTEIMLASKLRPLTRQDFPDWQSHRQHLIDLIQMRRKRRQKGVVANFDPTDFDPETEFYKIGKGSLGGKARGLAFIASLLRHNRLLHQDYKNIDIRIPYTLVITTEGFEAFVEDNQLRDLAKSELSDKEIAERFVQGRFPQWLTNALRPYVKHVTYPLAVRSSSLLEDAQNHAYAGLYQTYMLPNDQANPEQRLNYLIQAIKLVYASTYFQSPRQYAKRLGHRTEEEKMGVIIQQMIGSRYGNFFYPAISGVLQSHNYYPLERMKPEDGVATIAMGLGCMVVGGEQSLRFCPRYPNLLLQRSTVEDILTYAQRHFYALHMGHWPELGLDENITLIRREINDAAEELPVKLLSSTYLPEEHRIRDTTQIPGPRILTFAGVLKYELFPLAELLQQAMAVGQESMGCPVEMEFSVNLYPDKQPPEFCFLQLRPMSARADAMQVNISQDNIANAFCYSTNAMGNTRSNTIYDIIYVKPETFGASRTREIARQVGELNAVLAKQNRKYLLIGPGRWGSTDNWLGIPVNWADISGVGAIVETVSKEINAEPSQGNHFFHNLATLGINYLCVAQRKPDFLDWPWLAQQPIAHQTHDVAHVSLNEPLILKVDGRTSRGVINVAQKKNDS